MKNILLLSILALLLTACMSAPKGPQKLELKSPQETSFTAYRSVSLSKEYAGEQLIREKEEAVDFMVQAKPVEKKTDNVTVAVELSTVEKNGLLSLHDYGFPEEKEAIEFHYTPHGEVLKAGSFNKRSLFYVPPLPLPSQPVEKGDTWVLNHVWVSASGLELKLNVIGIHKGYKSCGEASPCVRMEVSGSVAPASDRVVGMELSSQVSGELLFSIPKGEVHSSEVRSIETLVFPNRKIESKSCMVSVPLKEKKSLKKVSFPKCELN